MNAASGKCVWTSVVIGALSVAWPLAPCSGQSVAPPGAPMDLELEWTAIAGCASQEEMRAEIGRLIGASNPAARGIRVRAEITGEPNALSLRVELDGPNGPALRALRGQGCETLAAAAALVIAMAIDPEHALERASEERAPAPAAHEPLADPWETPVVPRSEAQIPFLASARALGVWGPLPAFAGGGELMVGARFESVELWIGGAGFAEQEVVARRGGGTFGLGYARVRGAVPLEVGPLEVVTGVEVELGSLWGRAFGVPDVQLGIATWIAAGAGLDLRAWLPLSLRGARGSELGLSVLVDLTAPLYRPEYVLAVAERELLHQAGDVGVYLGVGLLFRGR